MATTTFSLRTLLVLAAAAAALSAGEAEAQYSEDEPRFVSFAVRTSVVVPGEVEAESKCSGDACPDDDSASDDADRGASLNMGAELLLRLSDVMRLGFGIDAQLTSFELEEGPNKGEDYGRFVRLPVIGEARIGLTDSLALPLRLFVGPTIFLPNGALEDTLENNEDLCDAQPGCSTDGTTGVGVVVGGGIGLLVDLGPVSLRGDLLVGFDWVRLQTVEFDDATISINMNSLMIAPSLALEI